VLTYKYSRNEYVLKREHSHYIVDWVIKPSFIKYLPKISKKIPLDHEKKFLFV